MSTPSIIKNLVSSAATIAAAKATPSARKFEGVLVQAKDQFEKVAKDANKNQTRPESLIFDASNAVSLAMLALTGYVQSGNFNSSVINSIYDFVELIEGINTQMLRLFPIDDRHNLSQEAQGALEVIQDHSNENRSWVDGVLEENGITPGRKTPPPVLQA